jgi:hypothetical protein
MPNRLEWDDVQSGYKKALQNFLVSKEKPVVNEDAIKEVPVITISDDNDAMEVSAENVDHKNSVKSPVGEEEPIAVDESGENEVEPADAAVVVNPDSSITDKALTDNQTKVYKFNSHQHSPFPSIISFTAWIILVSLIVLRYVFHCFKCSKEYLSQLYCLLLIQSLKYYPLTAKSVPF